MAKKKSNRTRVTTGGRVDMSKGGRVAKAVGGRMPPKGLRPNPEIDPPRNVVPPKGQSIGDGSLPVRKTNEPKPKPVKPKRPQPAPAPTPGGGGRGPIRGDEDPTRGAAPSPAPQVPVSPRGDVLPNFTSPAPADAAQRPPIQAPRPGTNQDRVTAQPFRPTPTPAPAEGTQRPPTSTTAQSKSR